MGSGGAQSPASSTLATSVRAHACCNGALYHSCRSRCNCCFPWLRWCLPQQCAPHAWLFLVPPACRRRQVRVHQHLHTGLNFYQPQKSTNVLRHKILVLNSCQCQFVNGHNSGAAGINFIFSMFLLVRYCKALEEESFHRNSSDFLAMLLFGALHLLSHSVHCSGSWNISCARCPRSRVCNPLLYLPNPDSPAPAHMLRRTDAPRHAHRLRACAAGYDILISHAACAGAALMLVSAPFTGVLILGHSLASMVLYVWARQNRHVRMSLFGLFNFNAPYFPWVMLLTSMALGASPIRDLLGIAAGHIYFYLQFVLPRINNRASGYVRAPGFVRALFRERQNVTILDSNHAVHVQGPAAMHNADAAGVAAAAGAGVGAAARQPAVQGPGDAQQPAGHHHID